MDKKLFDEFIQYYRLNPNCGQLITYRFLRKSITINTTEHTMQLDEDNNDDYTEED